MRTSTAPVRNFSVFRFYVRSDCVKTSTWEWNTLLRACRPFNGYVYSESFSLQFPVFIPQMPSHGYLRFILIQLPSLMFRFRTVETLASGSYNISNSTKVQLKSSNVSFHRFDLQLCNPAIVKICWKNWGKSRTPVLLFGWNRFVAVKSFTSLKVVEFCFVIVYSMWILWKLTVWIEW